MRSTPASLLRDLWILLVLVWIAGATATKRTVRRQPFALQLLQRGLTVAAAVLLFVPGLSVGWLGWRFVKPNPTVAYAGVAITAAGVTVAIWARAILGGNWSANVTVKQSHELALGGPYRFVRHPIYSGLTLAVLGTALAAGNLRGVVALAVSLFAWRIKWPMEERFMVEQFGDRYVDYRRRVKAIIPGVW